MSAAPICPTSIVHDEFPDPYVEMLAGAARAFAAAAGVPAVGSPSQGLRFVGRGGAPTAP